MRPLKAMKNGLLSVVLLFCMFISGARAMDEAPDTEYDSELEDFEVIEHMLEHSPDKDTPSTEKKASLEDELLLLVRKTEKRSAYSDSSLDKSDESKKERKSEEDEKDGVSVADENNDKDDDDDSTSSKDDSFSLHDFLDMKDYKSRRKRDLTIFEFFIGKPKANSRYRCPDLPAMTNGNRATCKRTDSEFGEIQTCTIKCSVGNKHKKEYHPYEVCGKATKYRWSYELKGLKSPQENCIKDAEKFSKSSATSNQKICSTKECIETGAYYTNKIDFSVNPCTNFYDFACGRWQKEVEIPPHRNMVSTYSIIRDRVKRELSETLNSRLTNRDIEAVKKAKIIFRSCMNTGVIQLRGGRPLINTLKGPLVWPILGMDECCDNVDLGESIAALRRYNNDNLMRFLVIHHSGKHMIGIYKGKLALSDSVFTSPDFAAVKKSYYVLIMRTALLLGANPWQAYRDVLDIRRFEAAYLKVLQKWRERDDEEQIMTIRHLAKKYDNKKIKFHQLFTKMIVEHKMTLDTKVKVKNPGWLADMLKLVEITPLRVLQNYIVWRFVKHRIENLSSRFRYLLLKFRYSYGLSAPAPRWDHCSRQIMYGLPGPTGNMFIKKYFSPEKKRAAHELFDHVRKGFIYNLKTEVNWMDVKTKAKAKQKAEAIRGYFGYNPKLYNDAKALNAQLKDYRFSELDYFGNTLKILEYAASSKFELLNLPYSDEKFVFRTRPSMVNAFYMPSRNVVILPAGEMQYPFYWGDKFLRVFQFGAIGTILGHEITHGFDNEGRRYDLNGDRVNWWTKKSLLQFKKRTTCIAKQYSSYYFKTASDYLDGKQTLAENIADLGGIRNSHAGYQIWLKTKGLKREEREPITGLTNDQMFFVGFANVRCAKARPFGAKSQLLLDPHSPGRFRVIGSLQDFGKFSEAFNCPSGSFMNPKKKCILW